MQRTWLVKLAAPVILAAALAACGDAGGPQLATVRVPKSNIGGGISTPDVATAPTSTTLGPTDVAAIGALADALTLDAYVASLPEPEPVAVAPAYTEPVIRATSSGHSDAWWMGVATCEQGGRNDPFFGYFSFMDGSMGGQPWDVQVAAGNALLASVGHEVGPWAEKCVIDGYAASPGG